MLHKQRSRGHVLPDPGWGNELTSVLIGAMTAVIGFFVKHLPDSTLNIDKYSRSKRLLGVASAMSAVTFVVLLAALRQTSETLLPDASANDVATSAPSRVQDFAFQLSILSTLIFASAFFAHWKKKLPKALLIAKNREAKDLHAWYDSDEYQHTKLANDIRGLEERIFNVKAQRKLLRDKFKSCSQKRLHTVMQQSCLAFIEGALTLPHTEAKKQAAQNGRKYLDTITVSGLEIVS